MSIKWESGLFEYKMGTARTNQRGVIMRLFLSTLTEMDYIETLNKIESSYDDKGQGVGQKQRELISRLRRALNYNYELEVIAKNEAGDIIGHIMLSEINLKADDQRYKALELASLIVDKPYRNEGLGKALVQAVEERAKSQHYTTIVVGCCPAYFEGLGYEPADKHNIFSKETNPSALRVKFLWDQLDEYPHGIVQDADMT